MFDCVIVMAGSGSRSGLGYNKALLKIGGIELFMHSVKTFSEINECKKIILVTNINDAGTVKEIIKKYPYNLEIVIGGSRRQDSVYEGIASASSDIVLIHDAARPFVCREDILKLYDAVCETSNWATLASKVSDTIKEKDIIVKTLNRSNLYAISTPQAVIRSQYLEYAERVKNIDLIDDMQPLEIVAHKDPVFVTQSNNNFKITNADDIEYAKFLLEGNKQMDYRTGLGYDIHRLEKGRKLILCGVEVDYQLGLAGHSDADVVLHAIMNALLGAMGKGDIGEHFPDTDPKYKNIDSKILFKEVMNLLNNEGFRIANLDVSIICQRPKLLKYKQAMKNVLVELLNIDEDKINIKANTNEGMDAIGKGLAIASLANVMIYK
ncbi:MAG: 2-C-methyl-D-erythritol 2,4-cyclodiphosphate synthase [Bacilli bacterium]|nr:2-C-methyl-D-erythritol 2,4-cyclodiphosphate synthase [Bacilli bacterium]